MKRIVPIVAIALTACQPPSGNGAEAEAMADNIEMLADNLEAMADNATEAAASSASSAPTSGWTYTEDKDEMRGATRRVARLEAAAPIHLDFPYGESIPVLNIRQDPKHGFDIFVTANGQFFCRSYDNDTLSVKFDDGPIREWPCAEADGGSSDIVFLNREQSFLAALRKAKKIIIEAPMYEAGRQQMTFNVQGLTWK